MEVHSAELKSSATGAAEAAVDEAAKQKENGNGNLATAVTSKNSSVDCSKVRIAGIETPTAAPMDSSESFLTKERLLLLEDSTLNEVPQYCKTVFASMNWQKIQQVDLLMALTYCIALESGFAFSDMVAQAELELTYWGSTFHKRNIEKLAKIQNDRISRNENYVLNMKFYPLPKITDIILIGIQSGDFLIVTITPGRNAPGQSICLPISRYVLSSIKSQSIPARFRNLRELSNELKEKIYVPARIHLSEISGCDVYLGLCGMPEEIIYLILKNLKLNMVQMLSKTNRKMRCLCENYRTLWLRLKSCEKLDVSTHLSASSLHLSTITNVE